MMEFDFEKLKVYQKAVDFTDGIYEITKKFPRHEQFGVVSQLRRTALSVALNIAEGAGRHNSNERRQFYRMSRSSIYECVPLLEVSYRQKYLSAKEYNQFKAKSIELAKMVSGLISSLPTPD